MTPLVAGVFMASAVVSLLRWLQVKDRRLLLLTGMFLMLGAAESLEWWYYWRFVFELAAAACGLALVALLDRRQGEMASRT